ncbi:DUF3089 domain-containing protein [Aurantiacibacter xanthus]|uniref:DUF3089 domain-containing protein n=1 Tax=Aurantiacibacter xanthus TaxID=1784712 RepID=A0A3A1P3A2_9SPHN|nr:DUF3089 domain-containing protein [Aurantiacibacter xanthus]
MLRKFLYFIVFGIVLVAGVLFALRIYADDVTRIALVPSSEFVAQAPLEEVAYNDPDMWFSRPGLAPEDDAARWQPAVASANDDEPQDTAAQVESPAGNAGTGTPAFAVFFVHPTSYLDRSHWNAPLDHEESQWRARLMVRGMASAFNDASEIWAPRYRQATFGAFLTDAPEAQQALDAAYADVSQAFDVFLESVGPDMPIVLAGHSQGGYHIARLLQERVVGTPLQERIAAVYPVGWPISLEHDLPALGLPACASADQPACISDWVSFAEPAEPGLLLTRYETTPGLDGQSRVGSPILCVNPLTGATGGEAAASANLGTLVPNADLSDGELVPAAVGARCDANGLLLIGEAIDMGQYVLPGNNYHVYDIPLFWANLKADVVRRVTAWQQARS